MACVAFDAGVVIGLLDVRDSHHDAATRAFAEHASDDLRMPASAYAEVLVRPAREGRLGDVKAEISSLGIRVDALAPEAAERAAMLRGRSGMLMLADALVLAYAETVGAGVVLTTDRRLSRLSARVRVVA